MQKLYATNNNYKAYMLHNNMIADNAGLGYIIQAQFKK